MSDSIGKVVVGQLAQCFEQSGANFGVIIGVYDKSFRVLLKNGNTRNKITDIEMLEEMKTMGLINTYMKTQPLFIKGVPVMSGKKTVGFFRKREAYTFEPVAI